MLEPATNLNGRGQLPAQSAVTLAVMRYLAITAHPHLLISIGFLAQILKDYLTAKSNNSPFV